MGFCFGVKEAVNLVEETMKIHPKQKIYILGMLVHNKNVMDSILKKGVKVIEEDEIDILKKEDVVIVRAHGTLKENYAKLKATECTVYDAACIFVKKARDVLFDKESFGKKIIFIGDKDHPEVKGIVSYSKNVEIYEDFESLRQAKLDKKEEYFVLAQTTLNKKMFDKIKEYIEKNFKNSEIGDTICGATSERQEAVEELAREVDVVLVIGGKKSSNTKKLYNISKKINSNTYLLENSGDLDINCVIGKTKIGITAGASTPEESINSIEKYIREETRNGKF